MQYVYAISDGSYIKIGISKNPQQRIKQLNTGNVKKLVLLGYFKGGRELEKHIHYKFRTVRYNSEWMNPSDELVNYLNKKFDNTYIEVEDGVIKSYFCIKNV